MEEKKGGKDSCTHDFKLSFMKEHDIFIGMPVDNKKK